MAGSTHAKHAQYAILIRRGDGAAWVRFRFPLGLLLGQDVTLVGMLALDLTRTGDLETLLALEFVLLSAWEVVYWVYRVMLCWYSSNRLFLLLGGQGGEVEEHPVAFQFRHQFHFSVLLQRLGELEG